MNKIENTNEQIENVERQDEVEEQADLKAKRVKALKTRVKGGFLAGMGRGCEE